LPLLRLLELVGEDFLLTTKARDVGLDLFHVAEQIDERLVLDGRFERVDARRQRAFRLLEPVPRRLDAAPGLFVVEQRGTSGKASSSAQINALRTAVMLERGARDEPEAACITSPPAHVRTFYSPA